MLKNGVVTSAANFTININNLGAKPCYNNMATGNPITPTDPTRDTTIFNINYTMLLVYSTKIVSGGGWICYRGYDGNTNTIGYQLRTNSSNMTAADTGYRYRIWLTSADGSKWVPINTSTSTNSTTARTLNTRAIDPFGAIVYRATNGTCNSGAGIGATGIWQQYTLTIGYSYVLTMTYPAPVYLRCTPQANGSAVMNDIVQALPSSNDGKIYIFLGVAYSATAMELHAEHPVYWHDGTGIRLWTGTEGGSSVTVDSALSNTSENPVQNKVIYSALNGKVDTEHTEGTVTTTVENGAFGFSAVSTDSSSNATGTIGASSYGSAVTYGDTTGTYGVGADSTGVYGNFYDNNFNATQFFNFTTTAGTIGNGTIPISITGVTAPTNNTDAANKKYVDDAVAGGGGGLPSVTTADNGKFLRVVNGAWAADTVPSANGEYF